MTGKENTERNIKNALLDGAFYYLQDKEYQNKTSIFAKVISSKEVAEHMLFECLQRVGIEQFKLHARSLGGIDLNKLTNNIQRDYAIVLYYLCNDLDKLTAKEARERVMHRFGFNSQDLSNCIFQFKSHVNKQFKRDNYPIMLEVFKKLLTFHKGRPKSKHIKIDVHFSREELHNLYHSQKMSVLDICEKLKISNRYYFHRILNQFNIEQRKGRAKAYTGAFKMDFDKFSTQAKIKCASHYISSAKT